MNGRIGVELVHDGLEVLLRGRGRSFDVGGFQSEAFASLHLRAHVDVRRRVVADDDHRKVRLNTRRRQGRSTFGGLGVQSGGAGASVQALCFGHVSATSVCAFTLRARHGATTRQRSSRRP